MNDISRFVILRMLKDADNGLLDVMEYVIIVLRPFLSSVTDLLISSH